MEQKIQIMPGLKLLVQPRADKSNGKEGKFILTTTEEGLKYLSGVVVVVGEGVTLPTGNKLMPISKVDDIVYYPLYKAHPYERDGIKYQIVDESDILHIERDGR